MHSSGGAQFRCCSVQAVHSSGGAQFRRCTAQAVHSLTCRAIYWIKVCMPSKSTCIVRIKHVHVRPPVWSVTGRCVILIIIHSTTLAVTCTCVYTQTVSPQCEGMLLYYLFDCVCFHPEVSGKFCLWHASVLFVLFAVSVSSPNEHRNRPFVSRALLTLGTSSTLGFSMCSAFDHVRATYGGHLFRHDL